MSVRYVKKSGYEVLLGLDRLPQFKLLHHNFKIGRLLIQAIEKWNGILLHTTFCARAQFCFRFCICWIITCILNVLFAIYLYSCLCLSDDNTCNLCLYLVPVSAGFAKFKFKWVSQVAPWRTQARTTMIMINITKTSTSSSIFRYSPNFQLLI